MECRSPLLITIMLACHVSPKPYELVGAPWGSDAGHKFRRLLQEHGLIDANYNSTPKGRAWVQYIINTPLPIATWSMPPRNDLEIIDAG